MLTCTDVEGGLGAVPGGVNDRMISLRYDFGPCVKCTLHRAGLVLILLSC